METEKRKRTTPAAASKLGGIHVWSNAVRNAARVGKCIEALPRVLPHSGVIKTKGEASAGPSKIPVVDSKATTAKPRGEVTRAHIMAMLEMHAANGFVTPRCATPCVVETEEKAPSTRDELPREAVSRAHMAMHEMHAANCAVTPRSATPCAVETEEKVPSYYERRAASRGSGPRAHGDA